MLPFCKTGKGLKELVITRAIEKLSYYYHSEHSLMALILLLESVPYFSSRTTGFLCCTSGL